MSDVYCVPPTASVFNWKRVCRGLKFQGIEQCDSFTTKFIIRNGGSDKTALLLPPLTQRFQVWVSNNGDMRTPLVKPRKFALAAGCSVLCRVRFVPPERGSSDYLWDHFQDRLAVRFGDETVISQPLYGLNILSKDDMPEDGLDSVELYPTCAMLEEVAEQQMEQCTIGFVKEKVLTKAESEVGGRTGDNQGAPTGDNQSAPTGDNQSAPTGDNQSARNSSRFRVENNDNPGVLTDNGLHAHTGAVAESPPPLDEAYGTLELGQQLYWQPTDENKYSPAGRDTDEVQWSIPDGPAPATPPDERPSHPRPTRKNSLVKLAPLNVKPSTPRKENKQPRMRPTLGSVDDSAVAQNVIKQLRMHLVKAAKQHDLPHEKCRTISLETFDDMVDRANHAQAEEEQRDHTDWMPEMTTKASPKLAKGNKIMEIEDDNEFYRILMEKGNKK